MSQTTRQEFLDTAERLFAARGFYGTSIAAISDDLGLTKQALLHHFGSKEKLYGEVLARISARFDALLAETADGRRDPKVHLISSLTTLHRAQTTRPAQARLLMRELLDNNARAEKAGNWYLKPFLTRLVTMVKAVPAWADASDAEALAAAYQFLGAITYYGISGPTLTAIFGGPAVNATDEAFPDRLQLMVEASLNARKPV